VVLAALPMVVVSGGWDCEAMPPPPPPLPPPPAKVVKEVGCEGLVAKKLTKRLGRVGRR